MEPIILQRALDQGASIINAVWGLFGVIFGSNGYAKLVVNTIMNNNYLLISVSLMLVGFVVGLLARIIHS